MLQHLALWACERFRSAEYIYLRKLPISFCATEVPAALPFANYITTAPSRVLVCLGAPAFAGAAAGAFLTKQKAHGLRSRQEGDCEFNHGGFKLSSGKLSSGKLCFLAGSSVLKLLFSGLLEALKL